MPRPARDPGRNGSRPLRRRASPSTPHQYQRRASGSPPTGRSEPRRPPPPAARAGSVGRSSARNMCSLVRNYAGPHESLAEGSAQVQVLLELRLRMSFRLQAIARGFAPVSDRRRSTTADERGGEQADRLEEVGVLDTSKRRSRGHVAPLGLPVVVEAEVLAAGGEGRSEELEDVQGDAARVHLLEDRANGLPSESLRQLDHGERVLLEVPRTPCEELVPSEVLRGLRCTCGTSSRGSRRCGRRRRPGARGSTRPHTPSR